MGAQVLPQALHMIPKNLAQSSIASKKLSFCSFLSRGPSVSPRISVSMLPSSSKLSFSVTAKARREVVVRAESNPEGEVETTENNVEDTEVVEEGEVNSQEEEVKEKRKPITKLGDIMGILNKRAIEASEGVRKVPDIRTGDVVEIKLEVPENKRRLSVYKGIVMSKQNAGIHTTIRIRRIIAGIGVEIVFPIYSPNIKEMKVLSHRKVRRARLYYLRDKLPKAVHFQMRKVCKVIFDS